MGIATSTVAISAIFASSIGSANAQVVAQPALGVGVPIAAAKVVPPPVGACPTGSPAGSACIVPPAGPVLPNFPAVAPALSGNGSNGFSITGNVQNVTGPACGPASTAGGTVMVNGITVTIPSDVIVQYPANTLTWAQAICGIAPIALDGTGGTAPAIYPGVDIHIEGNIVAPAGGVAFTASPHVAALVYITQNTLNVGSGYISAINYATGALTVASAAGGLPVTLLLNDPKGRYGLNQAAPDARFQVDTDNPTIKSGSSGYPMCIPRVAPPAIDARCPVVNRPTGAVGGCRNFAAANTAFRIVGADLSITPLNGFCRGFVMKAIAGMPGTANVRAVDIAVAGVDPDPREMAPFVVGDFINWQGTLKHVVGTPDVIWVHSIDANVGIFTQPATLPAYAAISDLRLGVDPEPKAAPVVIGVEATPRIIVVANTTDVASIVDLYYDDKGFSLPVATPRGPLVPDVAGIVKNEYFRWVSPESVTGTVADQVAVRARGQVIVPGSSVAQALAFGGGIYTQFIGPQPGRARVRQSKIVAIDASVQCVPGGPTIAGTQGCAVTQSPTRYVRAVMRSLCAPAASGTASATTDASGAAITLAIASVPATNLDSGVAGAGPNSGPYFNINGNRASLPGAGAVQYQGLPGLGFVGPGNGTCLQSAQYANGLFTGQYMAPVTEFIFPENTLAGFNVVPSNFWHMGFLAYGENGQGGNSALPVGQTSGTRPW